jgi:hypothetical protein
VAESGGFGGRELGLSVKDTFEFKSIPAGTYEVRGHLDILINPQPLPAGVEGSWVNRGCSAVFVSESQIVRVGPGAKPSINLTISQPLTPYYPIPDPETCETFVPVAGYNEWWTGD